MSLTERIDRAARSATVSQTVATVAVAPFYLAALAAAFLAHCLWTIVMYVKGAIVVGIQDGWRR